MTPVPAWKVALGRLADAWTLLKDEEDDDPSRDFLPGAPDLEANFEPPEPPGGLRPGSLAAAWEEIKAEEPPSPAYTPILPSAGPVVPSAGPTVADSLTMRPGSREAWEAPATSATATRNLQARRTILPRDQEQEFQVWYSRWAAIAGLDPDPDNPLHKYDYRAAYLDRSQPQVGVDGLYHWPSAFKDDDHPNRFVDGVDTKTGQDSTRGGATGGWDADRKSTRLNSSHSQISYAVFCLKK